MTTSRPANGADFADALERRSTQLPPPVRQAAADRLLDAIAVSFYGHRQPAAQFALATAGQVSGAGATIIGAAGKYSASDAAFVNGVIGHSSLAEDIGPGGHPGTFVIPAALAAGEIGHASGTRLIEAIVAGYEAGKIMAEVAHSRMSQRSFRQLSTVGAFGAAAAASVALGLSAKQFATAINLSANQACGLSQVYSEGTMDSFFQAGFASRAGVLSALLARAGATASEQSLDGTSGFFAAYTGSASVALALADALAAADSEHAVLKAQSKLYPVCALNQNTMQAIESALVSPFKASEVESVLIERPAGGDNGITALGLPNEAPFHSTLQAQMSARFTTAAALIGKPLADLGFYATSFADTEIREVSDRTVIRTWPDSRSRVTVTTKDGQSVVIETPRAEDDSWRVMSLADKFDQMVSPVIGRERMARLRATVGDVEALSDVAELVNQLAAEAP